MPKAPFLALVGPTASGKTDAALRIAGQLEAEIVSVDSMVVYRGMDVGTAKVTAKDRSLVPHHLLDLAEPGEAFSVAQYQRLAQNAVAGIRTRGRRPLLVGGSGLYFRAVVDGLEFPATDPATRKTLEAEAAGVGPGTLHGRLRSLDPVAAGKIEPGNLRRTVRALEVAAVTGRSFSSFAESWQLYPEGRVRAAGIELDRAELASRIEGRVRAMVEGGLLEEVRQLMARGSGPSLTAGQAIGYAEIIEHLAGRATLEEAVLRTVKRTKALARRQLAWFRRDPRIRWFRAGPEGAVGIAEELSEYLSG
jgi:tRNA dimethylallyltransferase